MDWRKGAAALIVLAAGFALAAGGATSLSSGITRAHGLTDEGCVCHGPNRASDGLPNGNTRPLFAMDGNPYHYAPGQAYNVTVGVADSDVAPQAGSNQGGFNLHVNIGTLAAAEGFEDFVVIEGSEATHSAQGDQNGRLFNLTWTAPAEAKEPAVFTLFVNAVNGNAQNDEGDHWNGLTFVVLNKGGKVGGAAGEVNPEEIGVKWLAHWVGIISFVAVAATLLIYYFVLKYGESVHTTDHRDRKER